MPPAESDKKYFWIAIVVLALGLFGGWRIASSSPGIDFFHIWGVGTVKGPKLPFKLVYDNEHHPEFVTQLQQYAEQYPSERLNLWLAENAQLYDSGFHPTGTPCFYTTHAVFHGGSPVVLGPDVAFWGFQISSTLVFVLGCTLLGVSFGLRWSQALLLTALLLILHRGLHSDIGVANVNRMQCGIFGIAIWWLNAVADKGKPVRAFLWFGLILGFSTMYKPNVALALALPGLALLFDRRFREFSGLAIGAAMGAAPGFASVLQGDHLETWLAWRSYVASIADQPFPLEAGNYALARLLDDAWVRNASIVFSILLVGVSAWWIRKTGPADKTAKPADARRYGMIAGIGLLLPLICAPVAWGHYMVLAIPLAIMLIAIYGQPTDRTKTLWLVVTVAGLFLGGVVPVAMIPGVPAELVLISIQAGLAMLMVAGLRAVNKSPNLL